MKLLSESPSITKKIGSILSKILKNGDILLFSGELGAGKTTFISGIAEGLGIKENLSSPSFTIINLYTIDSRKKFIHADFYRLATSDEISDTGLEDYIYNGSNIACIEWGDKIKSYPGLDYLEVKFEYFYSLNGDNDEDYNSDLEKRLITFNNTDKSIYWDRKLKIFRKLLKGQKCIFLE